MIFTEKFGHKVLFSGKRIISVLIFVILSVCLYGQEEKSNPADEVTTITIKNSGQTTYQKDPETGNDQIILEGAVELSVKKGTTTSDITADKITYDRKTEMLYADGNVKITTNSSSGSDTASASSFLMNSATLEGVFDGGRIVQTESDALNLPSGSVLIVFSDIFGKSESNTISFKNSSLTFCDDENPHWRIDASRTWLLPGGEFAFLNALFYVGSVPVLYFPAFYYPKDELVFNPVFTTRPREGYAIQTTTYLFGRKQSSDSSSSSSSSSSTGADASAEASVKAIYNFMRSTTLKEQKLEGLVLHNLDEKYTGDTSNYLKITTDLYTKLGGMVGVDGSYTPKESFVSKLGGKLYLGFSNTLFKDLNGNYSPYSPNTGKSYYDHSSFLGINDIPFRFGGNLLDISISKPVKLTVTMPIYSDPYFNYDFITNRSESMDWITYFFDLTKSADEETTPTLSSSFKWQASTSYSPTLPNFLKPYVSSVSLSLNSSLDFSTADARFTETVNRKTEYLYDTKVYDDPKWVNYTPSRKFYYPSQITPISGSLSFSGTLFEYPRSALSSSSKLPDFVITLNKPDELLTEEQLEEKLAKLEEKKAASEAENEENKELDETLHVQNDEVAEQTEDNAEEDDVYSFKFPELTLNVKSSTIPGGLTYKLGYSLTPNITTQFVYDNAFLKQSSDFDWNKAKSFMYTFKTPISLNSNLGYGGSFFTMTNSLSADTLWQGHDFIYRHIDATLSEKQQEATLKSILKSEESTILADLKARKFDLSGTNSVSLKPLSYIPTFSDTGVSYNVGMKIFRQKFIGDLENPEWDNLWLFGEDNEDNPLSDRITNHTFDVTLGAKELDSKFKQTFVFSTTLKPQVPKYSGTLTLSVPFVTFNLSQSWQETSLTDSTMKTNPLQQSLTFSLPANTNLPSFVYDLPDWVQTVSKVALDIISPFSFSESLNYNWEGDDAPYFDSMKLSLSWKQLTASYVASYTNGYELKEGSGWISSDIKGFRPTSFSLSYSSPSKTFYRWFNRISVAPTVKTSVVTDLLRPTNSYFSFDPTLSFKISEFATFSFSTSSKNSTLYWYFQDSGIYSGSRYGTSAFTRIWVDLWDSFRFDNEELRKHSGFKLKTLNFTFSHELHDWKFNMSWKFEPRIVTENGKKKYNYDPYITIGIVWNPMETVKAQIKDDYGKWSLN